MDARLAAYLARLPVPPDRAEIDPLAGAPWHAGSFRQQLAAAGLFWRFGALLAMHGVETGFLLASWVFIGSGALSGRLDAGWLAAWALCLGSTVPLRLGARWLEGVIAIGIGGLVKERLLAGAMLIDADIMRRKGAGELLGEVLESEAMERLGASGGLETALAGI